MPIKPSYALLAALAVIAAPAFAQDAAVPAADAQGSDNAAPQATGTEAPAQPADSAPAATAEPAAPADAPDAAAGADAAATAEGEAAATTSDEPKVGDYYVKSTYQDWTIRCIKADEGSDPCELYQLMKDSDGNSVAELTMIPLANGDAAAGATLVAPLETDLIKGLGFSIDGGKARGYPFSFCAPVGCISRMGFTAAELSGLKRGNEALVTLLPFGADPKKPVNLALSLSGFTAAFDDLSKIAAEARGNAEAKPAE